MRYCGPEIEPWQMVRGLQACIAIALSVRFGTAGKRLMSRIRKLDDVGVLNDLRRASASAQSLQDIRDRLPARQDRRLR